MISNLYSVVAFVNNSQTLNSGSAFDRIHIGHIAKRHNNSYLKVCPITCSNLKTKHYTGRFLHDLCESLHLPAISWHYIHVKKLQETQLSDFYDYKSNVFKQTGPLGLKWTRTLSNLCSTEGFQPSQNFIEKPRVYRFFFHHSGILSRDATTGRPVRPWSHLNFQTP